MDDMDCGASSVVSGSSVPPTVYSYGSGSSTTWSGSSTDSESDKGVITRPSKFTRTDVPLGACAVTLEGLRSNRLVQCRVVAVDVSTGTESEPGPIAVAYTDMSVPPAPSAPVCAVDLKSPGCIVLTWRVPEGSAKDDAASAPTAHQVQAAPALSRPFQTVSKRKGGDGKGGANKGGTKSGSNAVAGTGPRDASSPGELQWRVVYEGAESRVTLAGTRAVRTGRIHRLPMPRLQRRGRGSVRQTHDAQARRRGSVAAGTPHVYVRDARRR